MPTTAARPGRFDRPRRDTPIRRPAARRWRRRRSSRSIATSGWFPLVGWRRPGRTPPPGLSHRYPRCLPVPPPLRRQHRVDDLVGPFALDDLVLAELRPAPPPDLTQAPCRPTLSAVAPSP